MATEGHPSPITVRDPRARAWHRDAVAPIALVVLVSASAVVRFAASSGVRAPWIAPDEMSYALAGRSLWETGHMRVLGHAVFYGFYPAFAGLPLAVLGTAHGLLVLQACQAVLVSLTVAVTYAWARPLVGASWALAVAAMTAALPALAFSGLIMTETLYLPAATLALWLLARALERPSTRNQVLAGGAVTLVMAVRLQGVVLIPTVVVALLVMTWFATDRPPLRRFGPLLATIGIGVGALYLARIAVSSGAGPLGAYDAAAGSGYRLGSVLGWAGREAGDTFLLVVGIPLIATFSLALAHLRERARDTAISALLAVTFAYGLFTVAQVGAFASRYVQQLAERDLVSLVPPLLIAFTVWLQRGMPRPQPATAIVAVLVATAAILLPVRELVTDRAVPDAFMTVPLLEFAKATSRDTLAVVWPVVAAVLVLVAMIAPRRSAGALAGLVAVTLVGASALTQRAIDHRSQFDRTDFFGQSPTDWIDRVAHRPALYLDDGDLAWNGIWQQAFWNTRLGRVVTLEAGGGPVVGSRHQLVSVDSRGRLLQAEGSSVHARFVVAPARLTLVGSRVAQIGQGRDEPGLVLWRPRGSDVALSTRVQGLVGHSTMVQPVTVTVFACGPGRLVMKLVAIQGSHDVFQGMPGIRVSVDRLRPVEVPVRPGFRSQLSVAAPRNVNGRQSCIFRLSPSGLVGSTGIEFERGVIPSSTLGGVHSLVSGPHATDVSVRLTGSVSPASTPRLAYCLHGQFLMLVAGAPRWDPKYRGATVAIFVAGQGLTCNHPPTYVRHGFASAAMHVPADVYPYYAP